MAEIQKQKKVLVLDGGGIKGIFQIKFFEHLEKTYPQKDPLWILNNVDYFTGTSVGTMNMLVIILQYTVPDMINIYDFLVKNYFSKSNYNGGFFKRFNLLFKDSLDKNKFKEYFNIIIKDSPLNKKIMNGEIKLEGISKTTGLNVANFNFKHLKELYPDKIFLMTSLNISTGSLQLFSSLVAPNFTCEITNQVTLFDAVRASSAIPIFFPQHQIKICSDQYFVDGALAGANSPGHLMTALLFFFGITNIKVFILGTGSNVNVNSKKPKKGIFGIVTILDTLMGAGQGSSSFITTFPLVKGNIRYLTMPNIDNYVIGDPMNVKAYYKNLEMMSQEGYFEKILFRSPSQNLNNISQDPDKALSWILWLKNYFSLEE